MRFTPTSKITQLVQCNLQAAPWVYMFIHSAQLVCSRLLTFIKLIYASQMFKQLLPILQNGSHQESEFLTKNTAGVTNFTMSF